MTYTFSLLNSRLKVTDCSGFKVTFINKRFESQREKPYLLTCTPKTQSSLCIHMVWIESSLSEWRNLVVQNAPSEYSDQTARMRSLIWIFAACIYSKVRLLTLPLVVSFFVYSWRLLCWVSLVCRAYWLSKTLNIMVPIMWPLRWNT